MEKEIKVPFLGEGIEKITICAWLYQPGDIIEAGADLLEIEADKALFYIPCETRALLKRILILTGQEAAIGQTVALIEPA